ncbi:uncharacterized protein LOC117200499 isoform X3 [Orcinus orca]|uniref:uncharacterized protein LOC117200499 isoform X3 n=1 Tax=Orcinus orca TaxID=9733 RepID=UPI0021131B90|nr:uncharacterized protein LOC117200499 isoform X3 [Orcinus orca]
MHFARFRIQLEDLKVNDPPRSLMEVGGMPSPGSSLKESSVPNLIPQPISFQRDSGELSWHYGWTRTRMSPSSRGLKAMRQSMQEEKQKRLLNPRRSQSSASTDPTYNDVLQFSFGDASIHPSLPPSLLPRPCGSRGIHSHSRYTKSWLIGSLHSCGPRDFFGDGL